ncbi:BcABA1, cytochrome P450 monooxygenase [Xylariomycetidae sp. FL0641]|nr:BcABA1, cytochrome P450 monooxygenase [Xylariomycetidae sp. FL0641]
MPTYQELSALAGIILTGYYLVTAFSAWYRFRHIPGPFLASFSWLWMAYIQYTGKQYEAYKTLAKKHGPLFQVAPGHIVTSDIATIQKTAAVGSDYLKDVWYSSVRIDPHVQTMFSLTDTKEHQAMKSKLTRGYSGRETDNLEPKVDIILDTLIDMIRRNYATGSATQKQPFLDLAVVPSYFTLDVISYIAFGEELGHCRTNSDRLGIMEEAHRYFPAQCVVVNVPMLRRFILSPTFLKYFGPKTTDKSGIGCTMGIAEAASDRVAAGDLEDQNNLLGLFARSGLSKRLCQAEATFALFAGYDTTASVIRTCMLHVVTSPRVYSSLKSAIAEAVRTGLASSPIKYSEARRIPYLEAIIFEGLRMRPGNVAGFFKTVPPEGDVVDGRFLPGGTSLGVHMFPFLRDQAVFGNDADLFRPERWLEADAVSYAEMERVTMLVFGSGRTRCAGQPLALMELYKVVFEFLRAFDWDLVYPMKPMFSKTHSIMIDTDLWMRVTEAKL